jgi:hypothetical protein
MLKKIFAMTLLTVGLGTTGAVQASAATQTRDGLWMHINVRGAENENVSINLPLSMIEKMANLIPDDAKGDSRLRFNDEDITVTELREIWSDLRKQPDATFITVDETDSKVRVAKRGGYLIVRAHEQKGGRNEQVEMKIPGTVVDALLSSPGEQLNMTAALQALARHGEGELVTVTGDGETVRIWVDATSDSRSR